MSFILHFLDFVLFAVLAYDTMSFLYYLRKKAESAPMLADYSRLCYTWIFYFALRSLGCCCCGGFIGGLFHLVLVIARAFIILPILNGAEMAKSALIDRNIAAKYVKELVQLVQSKMGNLQASS